MENGVEIRQENDIRKEREVNTEITDSFGPWMMADLDANEDGPHDDGLVDIRDLVGNQDVGKMGETSLSGRQRRLNVIISEKEIANAPNNSLANKGKQVATGSVKTMDNGKCSSSSSVPRRAASNPEHVIVRGATSKHFLHALKDMVCKHKPFMVGLLEPRASGSHADDICKKIGFDNWLRVEAVSFSESIIINVVQTHPQFVLLKACHLKSWFLSIVYASPDYGLRKLVWRDLDQISLGINGPWLPIGDYNFVLFANETSSTYTFN
ncbi:hypothetical protein PTKIN_Ptkin09bG0187600 [Pterospermum kingtungense]